MIIKGSQRGNGAQLARHLMNVADNDHISVHEVRGFVSQNLLGAFNEADAISKGTRCKQFLFSVSFNPPSNKSVPIETFLDAINRTEEKLGLTGQPRAIVFHEKEGRRHAHAVWSRIDAAEMKAINMSFFKGKLNDLSREMYLENGWELPRGFRDQAYKNPLNFTLAEFQAAKRIGLDDPREIKQVFASAYQQSDSAKAFKAALEDSGYYLARGDRRGLVAVDLHGQVYSVARYCGVKTKELRAKFGNPDNLASVDQTKSVIDKNLSQKMRGFMAEQRAQYKSDLSPLLAEKKSLVANQRIERAKLKRLQVRRHTQETKARAARYRTGLMGVVDLLFGKKSAIRRENEADLLRCKKRDLAEREALFGLQHKDRRQLQVRIATLRAEESAKRKKLTVKMADLLNITREYRDTQQHEKNNGLRPRGRGKGRGRDRSLDLSL